MPNEKPDVKPDDNYDSLLKQITSLKQELEIVKKQLESKHDVSILLSEEKFKTITAIANDAIIQMDDQGRVIFWNNAAEKIFGYTWEEVEGKDLHQLLVPSRFISPFVCVHRG